MKIVEFDKTYIENAKILAAANYLEEQKDVPFLPKVETLPDLESFADNGLGVAALDNDHLIGFLCCYEPWNNAFDSIAKGTYSPIYAHGAVKENRRFIYQRMYQAAAEKWVQNKITYHAIGHYAHDTEAIHAFFNYGFGLRCMDAIRTMEELECPLCDGLTYKELSKSEVSKVRELRRMESEHFGNSPCFMYSSLDDFKSWLADAEKSDTRLFLAEDQGMPIAFVEVRNTGETFVSEASTMLNICGAFCLPEYRGRFIFQNLLNFMIRKLKEEGYQLLGVDFESFNPTAYGFWLKYFTAYTNSVVRRIDECALHD